MTQGLYAKLVGNSVRWADRDKLALRMNGYAFPVSITEDEFGWIRDYVREHKFKSAYELGTGFGLSACAIGLGLRGHGGKLVTMDCYSEERYDSAGSHPRPCDVNSNSDGRHIAEELLTRFELTDVVELKFGISPEGVAEVLGDRLLDLAFIDGAHFDDQLLDDVWAIWDRLSAPFTVMLHDVRCFKQDTLDAIGERLGAKMAMVDVPRTFTLGYYEVSA